MKKFISPRITLVFIAALFLLPLVFAWLMYTGTLEFKPGSTKNLGTLVEPPVPLDLPSLSAVNSDGTAIPAADVLLEHWVVLYPVIGVCLDNCQQHLISLRQVHIASGRHGTRIRLAVLIDRTNPTETRELIASVYDQFIVLTDQEDSVSDAIQAAVSPSLPNAATYLIDPLGNIMMAYTDDADPNDLKKDLKRLLTWSKLDDQS